MSKIQHHLNYHWPASLITAVFFILAALYSIITPLFESPDELWHYPFVWHLARAGELPLQEPAKPQLWQQEGSQPPLYYAGSALLTAPITTDDLASLLYRNPHADIGIVKPDGNANIVVHTAQERWPWRGAVLAVHVARFFSVVLGTGTVLCLYALGRSLWPERPALALVAMAFVAFNPMFIFISGSVNNDNLITFLAALTLWRLVSLTIALNENVPPNPPAGGAPGKIPPSGGPGGQLKPPQGLSSPISQANPPPLREGLGEGSAWSPKWGCWFQSTSLLGQNATPSLTLPLGGGGNLWSFIKFPYLWVKHSSGGVGDEGKEPSLYRFVGLGILGGLAALAKLSGLGLAGLTGLTLLWQGWRRRSWRIAIAGNAIVGALTGTIAGWWYWRNLQLYGDWSGTAVMVAMMGPRPVQPTPGQLLAEIPGLMRSFWGLFGYFSIPLPAFIYWLLNGLLIVGFIGLLIALLPSQRAQKIPPRLAQVWPILLGWMLILLTGFIRWTLRTPATQGRLLFPLLGAVALLWAIGWLALAPPPCRTNLSLFYKSFSLFHNKISWLWPALPGAAMFILAIWVPWGVIAPAYTLPEPVTSLPPSAQPLKVTFDNGIQLLGYDSQGSAIQPGDTLPLTLYWRSDRPIETDYTLFLHLLDEYDLVIAQRNVFHGPGLYPTSQWTPDETFADHYALYLPNTTFSPGQARFEAGLYDHTTGVRLPTSNGRDNARFGAIEIRARQNGDAPNSQFLLFEDDIALVGYDVHPRQITPAETVTLTLYWQGQGRPGHNYKVFAHLVGQDEMRIAQHDSEPQNGAAPTSAWVAGEMIVDEHSLVTASDAPPGVYRLVVGMYDGQTGQRLRLLQDGQTSTQADSVTLSGVRLVAQP